MISWTDGRPLAAQNKSPQANATEKAVAEALAKLRALKAPSHHRFLRDAAEIVPPACIGLPLRDVTEALARQKCRHVKSWGGEFAHRIFLARKQAVSLPNGRSLNAYVWLSARSLKKSGRSKPATTAAPIYAAKVAFLEEVNAPYRQVLKQKRYPRGSAIDAVLRSPVAAREGARWPLVKKVVISYGPITDRWTDVTAQGFHVELEFAAVANHEVGGKNTFYYVASGLDPVRTVGDNQPPKDFTPRDTLGPVFGSGSNEWWRGTPEVVAANQQKYLKRKPQAGRAPD